ncbi:MAG: hypothetical protein Q8K58_12810 [Acidimicrobiales bacterium]|nr:hypothetical protein [Acidimicrobiales bacterium]
MDELGDDRALVVIPRCVEHHSVGGDLATASDGMLLGPSGFDGVGDQLGREHDVEALVFAGVEMSELGVDEERTCRCVDGAGQAERACSRNGDETGALFDSR